MNSRTLGFAALVVGWSLVASNPASGQEPSFALTLSAPSNVTAPAGETARFEAMARLSTSGLPGGSRGAEGWSLSMAAEGASIVGVTVAGTKADTVANGGLFDGGFEKSELTSGVGNAGAISAIVLAFTKNVTLPIAGEHNIAKLTLEATAPFPVIDDAGDPSCDPLTTRVFFQDGLRGSGQPVENKVTWDGLTYLPSKGDATIQVCPRIVKPLVLKVNVSGGSAGSPVGDSVPWNIDISPGKDVVPVAVDVLVVSNIPDSGGVQGWSMSVLTGNCFGLLSATTSGTVVDDLFANGFNKTELVDPARNSGQAGAVTAIVLSFTQARHLPEVGEAIVLKLAGNQDASQIASPGDTSDPCGVRIARLDPEFLRGSGQPVKTACTVNGVTRNPGVSSAAIQLRGIEEGLFVRGNANNDTKNDLADAIWIVNEVFRAGAPTRCRDAADANNDGQVDLSDALYIVGYQFQSAAPPPAPFPNCGVDPEGDGDGLSCAETQVRC